MNFEFWEQWSTEVLDYAHDAGKPDFFMFGEVYDADPEKLSPYVRKTDMNSVLDFTFQSQAVSFAAGNSAKNLQSLFAGDDYYTTPDSSATALPTFLGNHDMGRVGYFLRARMPRCSVTSSRTSCSSSRAASPSCTTATSRASPGAGGDKDARQTLFASEVAEYQNQQLVTGETVGSVDRYGTDAPLYAHIATLADAACGAPGARDRRADRALRRQRRGRLRVLARRPRRAGRVPRRGEQLRRREDRRRADPHEGRRLRGASRRTAPAVTANADGVASVTVPALGTVVLKADRTVSAPDAASAITVTAPAAGAGVTGVTPVAADVDDATWQETSFAWRVAGRDEWHALGTAEDTSPRVFHDTAGLANGTLVEYRAVSTDAAGNRSAASTYASVGNAVNLVEEEEPEQPIDLVTVPGSHNSEMGCAGDWAPGCEAAKLTLRADGIYAGTFDLPAGDVRVQGRAQRQLGRELRRQRRTRRRQHHLHPRRRTDHVLLEPDDEGGLVDRRGTHGDACPATSSPRSDAPATGSPNASRSLMQDGDKDGVYTWSTSSIPDGAYEGKVAHGGSWDENYGVGGAPGGANYTFTADRRASSSSSATRWRRTCSRSIVTDPPLAGSGQARAHWVSEDTLAWPAELLGARTRADVAWSLEHSPTRRSR